MKFGMYDGLFRPQTASDSEQKPIHSTVSEEYLAQFLIWLVNILNSVFTEWVNGKLNPAGNKPVLRELGA